MKEKFSICFIGCGGFARCFVPLFQKHPYVDKCYVCDLLPERAKEYQDLFHTEIIGSFEEAIRRPDIDAVAVFVQRHLHGKIVCAALNAGKHVYSAVPMASSIEDCKNIIEAVKSTRLIYMMGETCIYYPCSLYCKQEYEKGTFGKFVYGESQYHHDLQHFPPTSKAEPENMAVPPFYYATHSTSMLLNAVNDHVVKVSAVGYRDTEEDTYFEVGKNPWDNLYSNEFSLMQLSRGGNIRVNECRRIGYKAPSSYVSAFYGTKSCYQFHNAQHILTHLTEKGVTLEDVSDTVNPVAMTEAKGMDDFMERVANHKWQWTDPSPVQDALLKERPHLPKEFLDLASGHMNSHRFLVDDFCVAVHENKLPPVNAWVAARYTIPGIVAHESVCRGGELLDVPDFGDAPTDWNENK